MNRRAFLKSIILGVAGLAIAPALPTTGTRAALFVGETSKFAGDFIHARITQRKFMARIRISGDIIGASRKAGPGAFMAAYRYEMDNLISDINALPK